MGIIYFLLSLVLAIALLYTLIPDIFLHRIGLGSWKRQYSPGVALTFDDGPDPEITPRVLDILDQFGAKAAFFVVADKAVRYPEIIRRIIAEGHTLGLHSREHRHAWLTSPWATWREWENAGRMLEEIAGSPLEWARPPWGTFNLALWFWVRKRGMRAVLWNVEGHDWQAERTPARIRERILSRVNEGSVVVLHDGGPVVGARKKLLTVLPDLCRAIVEDLKLPLLPLAYPDWRLSRRISFVIWEKWEHLFARLYRVERIDAYNIFRLAKTRYDGPELYGENGELLARKGDIVGEIHLDSVRLQGKEVNMQKHVIKALRMARESLPVLARYIADSPDYRAIKVFLGLTMINRGVKGLGFNVQEVPSTFGARWIGGLQKIIMRVYHPAGKGRGTRRLSESPKLVWIPKDKLLELWLSKA